MYKNGTGVFSGMEIQTTTATISLVQLLIISSLISSRSRQNKIMEVMVHSELFCLLHLVSDSPAELICHSEMI